MVSPATSRTVGGSRIRSITGGGSADAGGADPARDGCIPPARALPQHQQWPPLVRSAVAAGHRPPSIPSCTRRRPAFGCACASCPEELRSSAALRARRPWRCVSALLRMEDRAQLREASAGLLNGPHTKQSGDRACRRAAYPSTKFGSGQLEIRSAKPSPRRRQRDPHSGTRTPPRPRR